MPFAQRIEHDLKREMANGHNRPAQTIVPTPETEQIACVPVSWAEKHPCSFYYPFAGHPLREVIVAHTNEP